MSTVRQPGRSKSEPIVLNGGGFGLFISYRKGRGYAGSRNWDHNFLTSFGQDLICLGIRKVHKYSWDIHSNFAFYHHTHTHIFNDGEDIFEEVFNNGEDIFEKVLMMVKTSLKKFSMMVKTSL